MGAWWFVESRLRDLLGRDLPLRYVGRPATASPAEGWSDAHRAEQQRIIESLHEPDLEPDPEPVREPVVERGVSHAG